MVMLKPTKEMIALKEAIKNETNLQKREELYKKLIKALRDDPRRERLRKAGFCC